MKDIIKIKVRGYHIDSYGHVNNTRYLEFLEEARWCLKDNHLHYFDDTADKYGLVVVNNTVDYLTSSYFGDTLRIESWISDIGNKSVKFQHDIINDKTNKLVVKAKATFVFYNRITNQSETIPKKLYKNFQILSNKSE